VSGACASLFSAAAASGYRSSPTCERDIAGAALIAAGQTSAGGLEGLEGTGAGSLADALALRAFATHPLVGSLDAARTLAAAALPMRSHSIYLSYQFSSFYGSELVIALKLTGRSAGLEGHSAQARLAPVADPSRPHLRPGTQTISSLTQFG
jgi:hypothetical protein